MNGKTLNFYFWSNNHDPWRTLIVGYFAWVAHIYYVTGEWVYGFFNPLGIGGAVIGLMPATMIFATLMQNVACSLNDRVYHQKAKKHI